MIRLLKYIELFQNPENVPYEVFEVEFQRDLFDCNFVDQNWKETFVKHGQSERYFDKAFTNQEIQNASIELLSAMITYLHRGITHWSQDSLLDYSELFIKLLKRLEYILSDSKQCKSCSRIIDSDSNFCKFCGSKAGRNHINDSKLIEIFNGIQKSLYENSEYTQDEFYEEFDKYKNYQKRVLSDNDYYRILVDIIFYSGFKATTVDRHLDVIHSYFNDYETVSKYDNDVIQKILSDGRMIKNATKVKACVANAKKMAEIVNKHGSFKKYTDAFNPGSSEEGLLEFKRSLERTFSYISQITSYHFMTDIGLNVLKPDRVILRILSRLDLIDDENDLEGAVRIGRLISAATGLPIRYIDIILVTYGQLDLPKITCICSEKNPKCELCGVKLHCYYNKSETKPIKHIKQTKDTAKLFVSKETLMPRIVFFNISFMSFYKGKQNDKLEGNFRYIKENANGMEKHNFDPIVIDGKEYCYGYVEPGYTKGGYENGRQKQIHIEKISGANNTAEKLDNVIVLWCAKMPEINKSVIVGWYREATVYRNVIKMPYEKNTDRGLPEFGYWVNVIAKKENCVLLPIKEREKDMWTAYRKNQNRAGFGFGQSNVWYAQEDCAKGYVERIIKQIEQYHEESWV